MADATGQPTDRARRRNAALAIALPLVAGGEGLRQYVYRDPVGIPTYCFGETKNPEWGKRYTIEECKGLLSDRVGQSIDEVEACVPGLPPSMLAAFASANYNLFLGGGGFCRSGMARKSNLGDRAGGCAVLLQYTKATLPGGAKIELPGLVKRRREEYELCIKDLH